MAVMPLTELKTALDRYGRVMGLDLGSKTIGLALSDVMRTIATPYDTIRRTKFTADARALLAAIDAEDVRALVIGLPISMDGTEGPRCQSTRQFAANLLEKRDLPIAFWDERLSTVAVERMLVDDVDMTRARRGQVVDKLAAAYILQGALDAR
ncbi:MAG TPA: Holliday junction resolvase RuvX [Rhodospirillaceae bacterium]|nr:Holliday junction resolvase RuvX [Magnetovibrio sp.]HBT43681.1 Holliday junction resolvase RuvX [Rhodospirillaceae bacterium]HCS68816.1 Holliday junction resolvase RuvX [Rhodospirillaceae bacterium]